MKPEDDMPVLDGPPEYGGPSPDCDREAEELRRFKNMAKALRDADLDGNGTVEEDELELLKGKLKTQRRIAIMAFGLMCFLGIYIAIWMPLDRIEQVSAALDLLWVTLGGIIATYMGAEAYVSRRT